MARSARPHRNLVRSYAQDLSLFGTPVARFGLAAMLVILLVLPTIVQDDFWLSVLIYSGITAIGAIGLNLLTGYTGQISLGHAFFIGAGAYARRSSAATWACRCPLWLLASAAVGAVLGGLIGPFALRLRGHYLAIVTLGLVFLGEHLWRNCDDRHRRQQRHLGARPGPPIGPVDLGAIEIAGENYSRNQGYFWLVWVLVAIVALLAKNLARTRPGRALQAVRDHDLAAEVIGVRAGRYKVGAFVVSSAIASMAGALFGSLPAARQPGRLDAAPVHPVHRDHHHRWAGYDLRVDPRSDLRRRTAGADRRVLQCHPRRRHGGGRGRLHQCLRAQPGHLRPVDRVVPGVRTPRLGGHLVPGQGLLQGLAVLLLTRGGVTCG